MLLMTFINAVHISHEYGRPQSPPDESDAP